MKARFQRVKTLALHTSVWAVLPLVIVLMPTEGASLVVFAPFAPGGAVGVMARAEGALVAATRFSSVAIVSSQEPGLAARLYAAGAFLVLDGARVAGCLPKEKVSP